MHTKWNTVSDLAPVNCPSMFKIEALIWVPLWRALTFQPFIWRAGSNPRIWKWNTKFILNLCMNHMVHVSCIMWRIKNQPSNSTSCSDNALRLLVLMAGTLNWGLQVMSSFSIWGCVLKGYFERGIFWRAKLHLKGIEDFNLEHCYPLIKSTTW